jgi:hypothetical protein
MNGKEAPISSSIRPKLVDTCLQGYSVPVHSLQDSLNRTFQKHRSSLLLIIAIEDNLLLGASTYAPSQKRVIKHSSLVTLTPWSKRRPHHRGRQNQVPARQRRPKDSYFYRKNLPKPLKCLKLLRKRLLSLRCPHLHRFMTKWGQTLFSSVPITDLSNGCEPLSRRTCHLPEART